MINLNHFTLKTKIYVEALKTEMLELQKLSTSTVLQTENIGYAPAYGEFIKKFKTKG